MTFATIKQCLNSSLIPKVSGYCNNLKTVLTVGFVYLSCLLLRGATLHLYNLCFKKKNKNQKNRIDATYSCKTYSCKEANSDL